MNNTAMWARKIARQHLEESLPRRWAHTKGVAGQARSLAPLLGCQADLLEGAAWLHDIGYAPDLVETGFHPLDGARYLRDAHNAQPALCQLVAHHSCAILEARERGLSDTLTQEFPPADPHLSRALTYCDMTTTPDGAPVDVKTRLAEIRNRYGPGSLVTRFIDHAEPQLTDAVRSIQDRK
ncbi:HD domain-containing protein [Actinomadura formosensis]|uniref:HD domain-containing protein n=1 Tax=Actinomadura formosensis TaxID=60706 RepID=UPI003D90DE81